MASSTVTPRRFLGQASARAALAILGFALLVVASLGNSGVARADAGTYKLIGGPFDRYVTITIYEYPESWYYGRIQLALASWNLAQTSGGAYVTSFLETTNWSISAVDYYVVDYGATNWRGVVVPFHSNGTMATSQVGFAATSNYAYAEARLNHYYLGADYTNTLPNRTQSTAAHEFGHALALLHDTPASLLMYSQISRFDTYGTYTPQAGDISDLDAAY